MEHKYRVWDKLRKEYLSAGTVSIEIHRGKNPCVKIILDNAMEVKDNRFIFEKCLNIKDKNDQELYKGDIFKHNKTLYFIEWSDTILGFCFIDITDKRNYRFGDWFTRVAKYIEKLGNINNNPELMEE